MSEDSLKTRFIRNLGFGAISRIIQTFVGFFIITYVMKTVGIKDWGILTVSVSIVTLLSVLQVSLSGGTSKRLTDFYTKDDHKEYLKYYSGTLIITIGVITAIVFFALVYDLLFLEKMKDFPLNKLRLIFYLTVINSIVIVLTLPGSAVLQSINRIDSVAKVNTMGFICRSILVFTFFLFNKTILTYALILLIETVVNFILTYFIVKQQAKTFSRISFSGIEKRYIIYIFKFNILNFINSLNYLFFIELPAILVAKKYGLVYSGYYGIGIQLNSLIRGFLNIIMNALSPVFNILKAQNKKNQLIQYYIISTKFFILIALLLSCLSTFFLKEIVLFWLSETNESMITFLKTFLVFTSVGIAFIPSALMIVSLEKLKSTSYIGLALSILVSCSIYFAPQGINEYLYVPLVLTLFFGIYNLHRALISFVSLNIKIDSLIRVLVFTSLCICSIGFFNSYFKEQIHLNGFITFLIIGCSSLFLFTKDDLQHFSSLIKK